MSNSLKIRILLFLLTLSFIATALTVDITLHKNDVLQSDAQKIERRLHEKEEFVKAFLNNPSTFGSLETLDKNEILASQIILDLKNTRSIYLCTYRNNELIFWGDNLFVLENSAALKEGSNIIKWNNGWYEAIKRTKGNFSALCFIPIRSDYSYQNKYLKNAFASDLIVSNNLEVARLNDTQSYSIKDNNGKYLFSIKLKSAVINTFYLEVSLWVLAILFVCIFMNAVCAWIASRTDIKLAILVFFIFFFFLRIIDLKTNGFYTHFGISVFKPSGDSFFFPSIGAFFLNIIATLWFLVFVYNYRLRLKLSKTLPGKPVSYAVFILLGFLVCFEAYQLNTIFYDLIINTNINIDLTNILNLDRFSWFGILILCICVLNLYLLLVIALIIGATLNINNRERLIIFLAGLLLVFLIKIVSNDVNIFFLLFALIIFLRGWVVYKNNNVFSLSVFVLVILIFSIIASVKLSGFQFLKEQEQRKIIAQRLESSNDPGAVSSFPDLEQNILKDETVLNFFKNKDASRGLLNDHLQRFYFNGYLSRYNLAMFEYKPGDDNSSERNKAEIEYYRGLVFSGSTKVSQYFYRNNNTFGFQNYFCLIPVKQDDQIIGTLVVELKSKSLQDSYALPPVLIDDKVKPDNEAHNYSYAYYNGGHLVNQYGDYVYDLINNDFKSKVGDFVFIEKNNYNHLIYHLKEQRLIVVSKPVMNGIMSLASVSFLFLVLLIFITTVIIINWFWVTINDKNIKLNNFNWNYILSKNHVLYKTRIQASMIAAIVVTLIVIGGITYFSISYQYHAQQEDLLLKHVNQVDEGIESQMLQNGVLNYNERLLSAFTSINATELNLYAANGNLLFTTQPKIYNNGLLASKMNALAYIYLSRYQRSEYLSNEQIGEMKYISAYKPIRNSRNETVAYLNVPDFSNENDYDQRIGQFLNTLINVYALIFVAIGFFAVFVANQITKPLTLVQKSLSETKIGRKNEPIIWDRDDEIGRLIKEYNKMIVALEESAQKFARSERETAWKEMAKQVAHEIKNPLTPLKLGVQLLEKSWKEKDPNFNVKFEKFSKSFIEQIESLSHIASEFSNFAKMPDTLLESVNLRETIEQSIEVFQPINRLTITLQDNTKSNPLVKGDKDQLLRSFNNLIKNALEAIPDSSEGTIEIIMEDMDKHVLVHVIDNGKGIPEGLRERIFNPNFTTKSSGTGLGLAFVKQAIENMAGTIRFETEMNKGNKFYITIPLASV